MRCEDSHEEIEGFSESAKTPKGLNKELFIITCSTENDLKEHSNKSKLAKVSSGTRSKASYSGGSKTALGTVYQSRCAAWVAVCILAEKSDAPSWGLAQNDNLKTLYCLRTIHPIDDLKVVTESANVVYIQAKHSVHNVATKKYDSPLAKCFDQFTRQFIEYVNNSGGKLARQQPLYLGKDRFVFITSPDSSEPIKKN